MINETERIKKLMGLPQLNESTIDGTISTSKGKIIYREGGKEFTYSVSVSNMFSDDTPLYIKSFNTLEKTFTFLKNKTEVTKDIREDKLKKIINNIKEKVQSFTIDARLYDINFKKIK